MSKEENQNNDAMEVMLALALIKQLKNDELITPLEYRRAEIEAQKMIDKIKV